VIKNLKRNLFRSLMNIQVKKSDPAYRHAIQFIIAFGFVSLFADVTYEGARGIIGAYLGILGASGAAVGIIAGTGELLGYSLRFFSGWISDRLKLGWSIVILGYLVNLVAVPLFALAGHLSFAIVLVFAERIGRAIRAPVRDAMLSNAATNTGVGWGFGLHEAMDQTGATLGPLITAGILYWKGNDYAWAFGLLAIPALLALSSLLFARIKFPDPENLEVKKTVISTQNFDRNYWRYMVYSAVFAAGFADFALVAFHLGKTHVINDPVIPLLYSLAMITDGIAALILGKLFDRIGIKTLIISSLLSAASIPLCFLGNISWIVAGLILWGIGMASQESIMRAVVTTLVAKERRALGHGLQNAVFGISWFAGSVLLGVIYDISVPVMVVFSAGLQLVSIPVLSFIIRKK
jgi:MFS family permease